MPWCSLLCWLLFLGTELDCKGLQRRPCLKARTLLFSFLLYFIFLPSLWIHFFRCVGELLCLFWNRTFVDWTSLFALFTFQWLASLCKLGNSWLHSGHPASSPQDLRTFQIFQTLKRRLGRGHVGDAEGERSIRKRVSSSFSPWGT